MTTRPPGYATFPGVASQYQYTPDLNLLDADTAHLAQGLGLWADSTGNTTVSRSGVDPSAFGVGSVKAITAVASAENGIQVRFDSTPPPPTIGPTDIVAGSFSVSTPTPSLQIRARWRYGTYPNLLNNGAWGPWVELVQGAVASYAMPIETNLNPAYDFAIPDIRYQAAGGGGTQVGDQVNISAILCHVGSPTTLFVPSLRIVGDLDMRVTVRDDWPATVATNGLMLGRYQNASTGAFSFVRGGTATVLSSWTVDGVGNEVRFHPIATDTEKTITIRATRIASSGALAFYEEGANTDNQSTTAGPLSLGAGVNLSLGARDLNGADPFDGELYSAEVRDGIDGPIVAKWLPSDQLRGEVLDPLVTILPIEDWVSIQPVPLPGSP